MTDLFWPGDHLAGDLMSDSAFLSAMVTAEQAWLHALVNAGIAPAAARADLAGIVTDADTDAIARGADVDGNPVSATVALLRERSGAMTGRWLHRGLTSQDVVDTALMICVRDVLRRILAECTTQATVLRDLTEKHRRTPALARTLTQAALPTTLGAKFARWLTGVLDAGEPLIGLTSALPAQIGGAVGTLAAATELTGSVDGALALTTACAEELGLVPALPWHTTRATITGLADALVTCTDAWGHIAADVATGCRTEIGEFTEGSSGASSTMPHKSNPVRSILIRRAALVAAPLGSILHTASATSVDERSDGAWHAEWATLRTLARNTTVAATHTSELLSGLRIDEARVAVNLAAAEGLRTEQHAMTELTGRAARSDYLGVTDRVIESTLIRAQRFIKEVPWPSPI